MQSLKTTELNALGATELALRIDSFFDEDFKSRYGDIWREPEVTATNVVQSAAVRALEEGKQKGAILLFYRCRFQMALCEQYSAFKNRLVHDNPPSGKWLNPHTQVIAASTRQAQIVSARTAFECLMEFVWYSREGRDVDIRPLEVREISQVAVRGRE